MNADLIPFVTKNSYLSSVRVSRPRHILVHMFNFSGLMPLVYWYPPDRIFNRSTIKKLPALPTLPLPCPCSQSSAVQILPNYIRLKHVHINITGLRWNPLYVNQPPWSDTLPQAGLRLDCTLLQSTLPHNASPRFPWSPVHQLPSFSEPWGHFL